MVVVIRARSKGLVRSLERRIATKVPGSSDEEESMSWCGGGGRAGSEVWTNVHERFDNAI